MADGSPPDLPSTNPEDAGREEYVGLFSFARLIELSNSVGTVLILGLLVLINIDIGGRAFFNAPVSGVPEMVRLSIVAIVFLQAAHTLKVGRLTRADVIINRVAAKWPRLSATLGVLYNITGAALFLIILKAVYPAFVLAWRDDLFIGALGDFTAPTWPTKLIILIGCVLVAIQFLIFAWCEARKIFQGGREEG
ncbi:MAG: TRAP transporter small permease [Rhodospirillales bacterium]|jgi:TRAP-type C4-dicarboxylate transport system permease small subunit|nr:TRAP transporter small permease [Rhodospirillales bacterium]MDP7424211.1 TRAP transporter small permease [Rhodospirillales bacterium]|tara:strand:- start:1103 stop:1684 length:582 start_codon:yes stop_codon:yes gene_type:complete